MALYFGDIFLMKNYNLQSLYAAFGSAPVSLTPTQISVFVSIIK